MLGVLCPPCPASQKMRPARVRQEDGSKTPRPGPAPRARTQWSKRCGSSTAPRLPPVHALNDPECRGFAVPPCVPLHGITTTQGQRIIARSAPVARSPRPPNRTVNAARPPGCPFAKGTGPDAMVHPLCRNIPAGGSPLPVGASAPEARGKVCGRQPAPWEKPRQPDDRQPHPPTRRVSRADGLSGRTVPPTIRPGRCRARCPSSHGHRSRPPRRPVHSRPRPCCQRAPHRPDRRGSAGPAA